MKNAPVISEVGHVAIRVADLDAAVEFATRVFGLSVTDRSDGSVWLSCDGNHHNVEYAEAGHNAVDHVGLVARDSDALAEIRSRIAAAGWSIVSDVPLGPGVEDGFAFEGPGGFVFEIYSRMKKVVADSSFAGVRPNRFGHVNFFVDNADAMQTLLVQLLDFRISDRIAENGTELGVFLRCNADHHGVGVFRGGDVLNHYAWEVTSIADLAALADLMDRRGASVLWGPVRHGMGRNIALYLQEPSGLVVEYYADMQRIYDEGNYVPGEWETAGHKWYSLWAPGIPDGFMGLGLPPVRERQQV
jgi:catechol-2,3-dioxygenase